MKRWAYLFIVILVVAGCAQRPAVRDVNYQDAFESSQCVETYTFQKHLGFHGLFERTLTCTKTDVPEEVGVKDLIP